MQAYRHTGVSGAEVLGARTIVMRAAFILMIAISAVSAQVSARPTLAGRLDTLAVGEYRCALPGDATGAAWQPVEERNFIIGNASTYAAKGGSGTYLLAGGTLTFTRGPMKGIRFQKKGSSTLREIDDQGNLGRLRCVRYIGSR